MNKFEQVHVRDGPHMVGGHVVCGSSRPKCPCGRERGELKGFLVEVHFLVRTYRLHFIF